MSGNSFATEDTERTEKHRDNERIVILERYDSANHERLRRNGLRDIVDWLCPRTSGESGMAELPVGLGERAPLTAGDRRLGGIPADHSRAMDLAVLVANPCTPGGLGRTHCLDTRCHR